MYAFQGLVNNHVYALGVSGNALMAGTLGGLSLLDKGNVQFNYTTASSGLKHNWITAVVPVGQEWMVGTYGAGVLALDRSGHFHSFEHATGSIWKSIPMPCWSPEITSSPERWATAFMCMSGNRNAGL